MTKKRKKVMATILMGVRAILLWYIVTVDRFAMALFIGVPLPSFHKERLKITEHTSDEEIEQEVIDQDKHLIKYYKDYLPKARKRATVLMEQHYL